MAIDIYNSNGDDDTAHSLNANTNKDGIQDIEEGRRPLTLRVAETSSNEQPPESITDNPGEENPDPLENITPNLPESRIKLYQSTNAAIVRLLLLSAIFLLVWFLKFIAIDAIANILNLGTTGIVSLSILLSILVGGLFVILAIALVLAWRRTSYEINTEEIILKNGSKIIRKTFETAAASIGLITVDQGPIAKRLNYGKVFLGGAKGPSGEEIMLNNVDDPYEVKAFIENLLGRVEKPQNTDTP